MTAFRLKKKESEKKGIRRVAHGRAEDAVGLLRDEDANPTEAVHEARKDMKKLRATLKLVRPLIGNKTYRRENARFRDAARALSDVRYAQVRAQTIDAAYQLFADDVIGSLEVGKYADMVVLSADPRTVSPEEVAELEVRATFLAGRQVYAANL